jgi:hypothetical protein
MNTKHTRLYIFSLQQELQIGQNQKQLVCNLLVMPRFSPVLPMANGFVPFSQANLQFQAYLVRGNDQLPTLDNHNDRYQPVSNGVPDLTTDRTALFNSIASYFTIDDGYGRDVESATVKKYLPETYRKAYVHAGSRQGAVMDDSYFCALKASSFDTPYPKNDKVNWSQVLAFCLQQPVLAEQLGLLYRNIKLEIPTPDYFETGGWFYFDLKEQPENPNSLHLLSNQQLQRYAGWIPPTSASRQLFSPVLFPVEDAGAGTGVFDEVFDEVQRYNDGFAKIVHAVQPLSNNHLLEKPDGLAPTIDLGIKLAWDDEQILEWYNRGFKSWDNIENEISDTVLVVGKYRIDVAEIDNPEWLNMDSESLEKTLTWKSQVSVTSEQLKAGNIDLGVFDEELGVEVAPARHGDKQEFWLPSFFTSWTGSSLCLPDPLAEKLNHIAAAKKQYISDQGGNPDDIPTQMYHQKKEDKIYLLYGQNYAFRVRLSDISGGGPGPDMDSVNFGEQKLAIHTFKRFVAPNIVKINSSESTESLILQRPRLNYPAVFFTGIDRKMAETELLKDREYLDELHSDKNPEAYKREVSLPDPDVDSVEIIVEVLSLEMDRNNSYQPSGTTKPKEPYILLYKTYRKFPAYQLNHLPVDDHIELPLAFRNVAVLHFGASPEDLGFDEPLTNESGPLYLPTARDIRLTIRACCKEKAAGYFGLEQFSMSLPSYFTLRKDPVKLEAAPLFNQPQDAFLSLFFLPENIPSPQSGIEQKAKGKGNEVTRNVIDQIIDITGLINKKGSILGIDNIRTQFGCSSKINHTLSPDHSSLSFASHDDFYHKWINILQLDLNRDWTWDLLKPNSFKVFRQWKTTLEEAWSEEEEAGGIFLTKGLNWQAMDTPDRSYTRLFFIDAFDPKPVPGTYPEPLQIRYFIEPNFKKMKQGENLVDLEWDNHPRAELETLLPITTPPAQVPKILSVGIALTPGSTEEELVHNKYSKTNDQQKFLWIEFDKPVQDNKDIYFARVLGYAPDPMLAELDPHLLTLLKMGNQHPFSDFFSRVDLLRNHLEREEPEPPLNIEPEWMRVIRPGQIIDQSGLGAMQAMLPAETENEEKPRHYLLPLPQGLYLDSEDLFGFFTYEFRVGHFDRSKWSTARGRFGSPLRLTGIQHPCPLLQVSTLREKDHILVSSRHAQSFNKGKNCTPAVPRTDIYAMLYAQVMQADGIHYRNILVDQLLLQKPLLTAEKDKLDAYKKHLLEREKSAGNSFIPPLPPVLEPGSAPHAVNYWNIETIREKLRFLGISENASLRVLAVELMPPNDFPIGPGREAPNARQSSNPFPLDKIRILRTSSLSPVMDACPAER